MLQHSWIKFFLNDTQHTQKYQETRCNEIKKIKYLQTKKGDRHSFALVAAFAARGDYEQCEKSLSKTRDFSDTFDCDLPLDTDFVDSDPATAAWSAIWKNRGGSETVHLNRPGLRERQTRLVVCRSLESLRVQLAVDSLTISPLARSFE